MLQAIAFVMLGGALGSATRYLITHFASDQTQHSGFPLGTLLVNVLGSLTVGYILSWSTDHSSDRWRLLAATGFCGGFTTFSAFAYESMAYFHAGRFAMMALNVGLNTALSFVALAMGVQLREGVK